MARFISYILHIVQYILRAYLIPNEIPLNRVLPLATDGLKLPRCTSGNKIPLPPFSIPNSWYLRILYPILPLLSSLSPLVCFYICELAYLCSVVSYFLIPHINVIFLWSIYLSFSDISLSIKSFKWIHVSASGKITVVFLWPSSIPLCVYVCVYHIFSIYSSVDGH